MQEPPLRKLGVYETDAFFPPADRTKLAMTLNGLLASRTFAAWAEGPDLDLDALLRARDGSRPGCGIVSLAHLDDGERQFVVSLLLGKLVTWMRRQPGTDKLRVLVYFDEVMGFVPPTAAPPAKPILTLFKQARAFGVGMVLATQNPVDVDYKGLSNAGTWMIGRLQTEQDKARLLDGLSSAGGGVDVGAAGDLIGSLDKRQFMLREPGAPAPSLFTTRWAMAYLRGPLTRDQIASLMADRKATAPPAEQAPTAEVPASPSADIADATGAAANAQPPRPVPPVRRRRPMRPPPPPHPHPGPAGRAPATARCPSLPVADGVPVRWLDPPRRGPPRRASAPPATRSPPRWSPGWPCCSTTTSSTYGTPRSTRPSSTRSAPPSIRRPPSRSITTTATCAPSPRRRHLPGHRRAARLEDLVPRRRQGARRPPVPQPHDAGAAQPRAEAGRPRRRAPRSSPPAARPPPTRARTRPRSSCSSATRRIAKARTALDSAADRVEQAQAAQQTRRSSEIVEGAGSLLGAVLGGRRSARTMAATWARAHRPQPQRRGVAAGRDGQEPGGRSPAGPRRPRGRPRRELAAIDDEWRAKPPRSRTSTSRSRRATSG